MPLLDLAQRQVGAETQTQGWLPVPVIEFVARQIGVPYMRVLEVATFYTMFNLAPVGRFMSRSAGRRRACCAARTTCWRRARTRACVKGKTTPDGLFTLTEVECLGTCANAPMVQINDDNYEDLTHDSTIAILEALARGETPKPARRSVARSSRPRAGRPP